MRGTAVTMNGGRHSKEKAGEVLHKNIATPVF